MVRCDDELASFLGERYCTPARISELIKAYCEEMKLMGEWNNAWPDERLRALGVSENFDIRYIGSKVADHYVDATPEEVALHNPDEVPQVLKKMDQQLERESRLQRRRGAEEEEEEEEEEEW